MRVPVTGAGGNLGPYVVPVLLQLGAASAVRDPAAELGWWGPPQCDAVRDPQAELAVEQRPLSDYDTALGIDLNTDGG